MKVIVNESGFYVGTHYEAGEEIDIHPKQAAPFLPPRGYQLSLPPEKPAKPVKSSEKAD